MTINYSTQNRDFLETHDWLGHPDNRVFIELTSKTFEEPAHSSSSSASASPPLALPAPGPSPVAEPGVAPPSSQGGDAVGAAPQPRGGAFGLVAGLRTLFELKRQGGLTEEEFSVAKKKLLQM